jgi:glyoxylase I family protein
MEFAYHHVALSVADLSDSVPFYGTFGFREVLRYDDPDGAYAISHLKLGEEVLELFCYRDHEPAPDTAASLGTDLPRLGTKHFGLRVASVEDAMRELEAQGIEALGEIREGRTKVRYFFVKDPSGNFVELVQDDRGL